MEGDTEMERNFSNTGRVGTSTTIFIFHFHGRPLQSAVLASSFVLCRPASPKVAKVDCLIDRWITRLKTNWEDSTQAIRTVAEGE
jgi:hypothetical protein